MLEICSVAKQLDSILISDVSLRIKDGEYFVLLGPSGEGKTVLLEIIAGLRRPDSGMVIWNSKDITSLPPEKRNFGVVYQDYALFPHLTVEKNITYGLRGGNRDKAAINERKNELAETLHITGLLDRLPETLSGGQQQRVALARALAVEPKLLLLDEPLAALDINIRLKLRRQLRRINKTMNIPVFHVTHDPEEAMTLGDHIGVMLDNRIRQIAAPETLFREPSDPDVADFLGMKNVLTVQNVKNNICTVSGEHIHVSSADDRTSHIWIKPEEIIISKSSFDSSARNQFKCTVTECENRQSLVAVKVRSSKLNLTVTITYSSFSQLQLDVGSQAYATFKSSAVHCF